MTQPLLGQRSRVELIAELYDRHAAGLFAYSHDQLGTADSASDVLVAVLSGVSDAEPPRAALYALARREIFLRDIVYSPAAVGLDPAAALVQRVLGDLRTHQREVLYLSGVCEMDASELSWVLDVAVDTADELTVSACRRFAQSLGYALASAKVPENMAEVFGALAVAPVRDVLNLAPWATPPARLRAAVLGPQAPPAVPAARRSASPLVRQLWPTTPEWPLPLAETGVPTGPAGPPIGASAFPVPDHMAEDRFPDPFAPRDPDAVSTHEATTEPMPRLGDSVLTALDTAALRPRRRLQRPRPRRAAPLSAPVPGDVLDDAPGREDFFRPLTPEARAARVHTDRLVAAAPRTETPPTSGTATPPIDRTETPVAPRTEPPSTGRTATPLDDRTATPAAETLQTSFREALPSPVPATETPRTPLTVVPPLGSGNLGNGNLGSGNPGSGTAGNLRSPGNPGDVLDDGLGDVLDDARPLPGWPLQTDQLDALADRERHRPAPAPFPSRETGRHASPAADRPPLSLPVWATRTETPASPELSSVERADPPFPSSAHRAAGPVRPSAVDWFADAAPSGTRTGETTPPPGPRTGETPAVPSGTRTGEPPATGALTRETPTALPVWSPRTDHLRTPTGRAQLRLPRWVMREDQSGDAPARTSPPNHTLTPYDAPPDDAATMPGNGFAAIPPVPLAPEQAEPAEQADPHPGLGGTGTVLSPSGRTASRKRAPRSHKAMKNATHHDWAWELIGFVIAVAIAMIVFFAVPMMTTP
ncbi:hypothetical protein [Streptosporangium sp. NPDC002524]|uniref:RNA polymerase sigma factor n=1 Tax=Streptosporangium sp. NPDC002524 TaxID=3154537 RepID=UPI0033267E9F